MIPSNPRLTRFSGFFTKRAVCAALVGVSLFGILAGSTSAAAKPGLVRNKQGVVFQGEVDETSKPGFVLITDAAGAKTELSSKNIDSIKYFDSPKEEFQARLDNLGRQDAPGRIALARWAISKNEYELASQAVASAKQIDPASQDVAALEKQIATKLPPAGTQPATTAPATTPSTTDGAGKTAMGPAKRLLTPDEIQWVRIREMRDTDRTVRMQVSAELRKKAVDAGIIKIAELRNMQVNEMGYRILHDGTPEMQHDVKVLNDPVPLAEFRTKVNRVLITGCAAANCHGGKFGGKLMLFGPQEKEEAALTNFVSIEKITKNVNGADRSMVDRTQPLQSLLLGYMLPPEISHFPHPAMPAYKGAVRNAQDPSYVATLEWMGKTLVPIAPTYDDIDLTTAAAKPPATPAKGKAAE